MTKIRVGFGYDVHRLVEGRELWLGGIKIEHTLGLLGHSDADVLIHALCDALLGAANMRDIGYHFPDTAGEYKDIDSKILLRKTIHCFQMELTTRCQLHFFSLPRLAFGDIHVFCYHFVLRFNRDKCVFQLPFSLSSELIQWHRRFKTQFAPTITVKFFFLNTVNSGSTVFFVQVREFDHV